MKIKYYQKDVDGKPTMYLADPQQREYLSEISGRRTLDKRDMLALSKMFGVEWDRVFEPEKAVR